MRGTMPAVRRYAIRRDVEAHRLRHSDERFHQRLESQKRLARPIATRFCSARGLAPTPSIIEGDDDLPTISPAVMSLRNPAGRQTKVALQRAPGL